MSTSDLGHDFRPGKIIAMHLNYPSRIAQRGRVPAHPSYFLKPATSVAATGGTIERPAGTELLAFEGEIALIIGVTASRISASLRDPIRTSLSAVPSGMRCVTNDWSRMARNRAMPGGTFAISSARKSLRQ